MTQEMQSLTLEGATYDLSSLPKTAIDTLVSLQFVETHLQQLKAELAVCQTAHVTYARSLKAELEQQASAESP